MLTSQTMLVYQVSPRLATNVVAFRLTWDITGNRPEKISVQLCNGNNYPCPDFRRPDIYECLQIT